MAIPILFVITDSGIGGSEKVMTDLLIHLDRKLFAPCGVVILKSKKELGIEWEKLGIPVFALNMKSLPTIGGFLSLRKIIGQTRPHIVQAFLFRSVQMVRLAKIFDRSFRMVSSPRVNYRFAPLTGKIIDWILKRMDDATICESRATKEYLCGHLGYSEKKTFVAPNGVDANKFKRNDQLRAQLRNELGIKGNEILIGGAGRLHKQKGFDIFLKALAGLGQTKPPYQVILAGEGPEKGTLEKLSRGKNLPVQFLGLRRDMPAIYSALDIYVQSSLYEGLPNALLEAMASGCASISTSVDGVVDFAKDGENSLLVSPGDPQSLAQAIRKIIEDPALRLKIVQGAQKIAEDFSIDNMVKDFEKVYSTLIS